MWAGLGNAPVVAQPLGFDAGGLISKIRQAARTARQNNKDCEHLAARVDQLAVLLPCVPQDPEARRLLAGLNDALLEAYAHHVLPGDRRGRTCHKLWTAGRQADRFREIDRKISSYLSMFPVISHIGITQRLDATGATTSHQSRLPLGSGAAGGVGEFTLPEIRTATNNFAVVLSDDGDSAARTTTTTYKGTLPNGHELVAVKRLDPGWRGAEDAFVTELEILAPLRHDHIIRLLGSCADGRERIIVTPYMTNGSLYDHLHGRRRVASSPVAVTWKTRVQVLLGAARAVRHLHCHASPLIIHGNVTSSNILLDSAWAPRLSDFGASVWRAAGVESQLAVEVVAADANNGYADPEYRSTGRLKPASDVYNLGMVMLEVLTGMPPVVPVWDDGKMAMAPMTLVSFALPSIQGGRLGDVLDTRPAASVPTMGKLVPAPLQLVANTAARCLLLHADNRPAISDVVAKLEQALELICKHGHF